MVKSGKDLNHINRQIGNGQTLHNNKEQDSVLTTDNFIRFMRCAKAGYLLTKQQSEYLDYTNRSDIEHFKKTCEKLFTAEEGIDEKGKVRKIEYGREYKVDDIVVRP